MRRYTELEINFNAIERVVEYLSLDQEAEVITDVRPPANVSNRQVRYIMRLISISSGQV